jgi:hypothetical protein
LPTVVLIAVRGTDGVAGTPLKWKNYYPEKTELKVLFLIDFYPVFAFPNAINGAMGLHRGG